ncbi:MAG: alpha-D-ribose 1-methylphosphonate 5-triphosphate diphosphatase [Pseudomonadota bacterium]
MSEAMVAALETGPTQIFANARMVLAGEVVTGSLVVAEGRIVDMDLGTGSVSGAVDLGGALLTPGLVELHTDNLEKHLRPRPGVIWPGAAAVIAHDGEVASTGITTVFDAIRVGTLTQRSAGHESLRYARGAADHIARLMATGVLRADHFLHLRAELCSNTVLEEMDEFAGEAMVRIVSIMDHTPGQRQFADEVKYRHYYQGKHGFSDAEMDAFITANKHLFAEVGAAHEAGVVSRAKALGAVLASHDDTTQAHVARSVEIAVDFAEFPTTLAAARACREAGIPVMMGAPNILRGGSHSGNVAAMELAEAGLLDILSSDYAPSSLLMAAMQIGVELGDLPGAVAMVTRTPARAVGLADRGEIAIGQRADLLTVADLDGVSVVTGVWSAGRKVG